MNTVVMSRYGASGVKKLTTLRELEMEVRGLQPVQNINDHQIPAYTEPIQPNYPVMKDDKSAPYSNGSCTKENCERLMDAIMECEPCKKIMKAMIRKELIIYLFILLCGGFLAAIIYKLLNPSHIVVHAPSSLPAYNPYMNTLAYQHAAPINAAFGSA